MLFGGIGSGFFDFVLNAVHLSDEDVKRIQEAVGSEVKSRIGLVSIGSLFGYLVGIVGLIVSVVGVIGC